MENELDLEQSSIRFYHGRFSQLLADSQLLLLALKDNYQKCLELISKEDEIKNCSSQKVKEIFLLSADPKNQENYNFYQSVKATHNEHKELKKTYNCLFSEFTRKTESGEIPNFIQVSYTDLQNKINKKSSHDQNLSNSAFTSPSKASHPILTDVEKERYIKSKAQSPQPSAKANLPLLQIIQPISTALLSFSNTSQSPQQTNKIQQNSENHNFPEKFANSNAIDTLHFSNAKKNDYSVPSSPSRNNIISNLSNKASFLINNDNNINLINDTNIHVESDNARPLKLGKTQAKSMFDFNVSKANAHHRKKHNNLPKKTKSDLLNRASSISFNVSRLNDISILSDQVSISQKKLEKLDYQLENIKLLSDEVIQKRISKIARLTLDTKVQSFNICNYADKEVNCDQIQNINEMKKMITKNAGEASQQLIAIQQLQDLQNYLGQLEVELKVILLSNDRKVSDFKTIIASLQAIDPLFYGDIVNNDKLETRLIETKEENEKRLKAIEKRVCEVQNQNYQIHSKNNDLSFMIESLKKQKMRMIQIPKANVKQLCNTLKKDRLVVKENNRKTTFYNIIQSHIDHKTQKLNERYSIQSFEKVENEISLLKQKVDHLKNKFDHLRAARENHSFVLTNNNELNFLHSKVRDLISQIDVEKMRMGGLFSKVEKQTKLLIQQNIPLPDPPHSLIIFRENVMKKKNMH